MRTSNRRRRWPIWYWAAAAVALPILAVMGLFAGAVPLLRHFYIPSEAMEPTLLKNDHILGWMQPPNPLRRGDIVLFRKGEGTWVKRIAALPGDRIAVVNGRVVLNGKVVTQQAVGTHLIQSFDGPTQAVRLREHFPGEEGDHFIYDAGLSPEDNFGPEVVAPGHVFVLGDNRDNSADSRVPRAEEGVEQLPIGDIRGIAWRYLWGPSLKFRQAVR